MECSVRSADQRQVEAEPYVAQFSYWQQGASEGSPGEGQQNAVLFGKITFYQWNRKKPLKAKSSQDKEGLGRRQRQCKWRQIPDRLERHLALRQ